MSDKEWKGWVSHHLVLFRWTAEEDLAMMELWRPSLERKNVTAPELWKASEHLAVSPPKWRADHLHGILEYIQAERSRKLSLDQQSERQAAEVSYSCEGCKGDGLLYDMPRPDNIRDGQWVGDVTCVVACWCAMGKKKEARSEQIVENYREAGKRTTGPWYHFERYEQLNPHWRQQKEQRVIEKRELAQAMAATVNADRSRGALGKKQEAEPKETKGPAPMKSLVAPIVKKAVARSQELEDFPF